MNRKQLEIHLSQTIEPFKNPKINLEQYQTPPRVAANLLHIAWLRGDIEGQAIVDLCAGTGILGIGAALLGAEVTLVEFDTDAFTILEQNVERIDETVNRIKEDIFEWEPKNIFDTVLINPPFGIQQRKLRDMDFIKRSSDLGRVIYAIHDGSPQNQQQLPQLYNKIGLEITEAYLEEFPLDQTYPWHQMRRKIHQVIIVRAQST